MKVLRSYSVSYTHLIENKGIEIQVSATPFKGDFSWETTLSWSKNNNKILSLAHNQNQLANASAGTMSLRDRSNTIHPVPLRQVVHIMQKRMIVFHLSGMEQDVYKRQYLTTYPQGFVIYLMSASLSFFLPLQLRWRWIPNVFVWHHSLPPVSYTHLFRFLPQYKRHVH